MIEGTQREVMENALIVSKTIKSSCGRRCLGQLSTKVSKEKSDDEYDLVKVLVLVKVIRSTQLDTKR